MGHKNKTLILIAAVAVMLVAATSASAYYEAWNGWFSSGTLTYGGNNYYYSDTGGIACDSTYSATRDTFYLPDTNFVTAFPFVCSAIHDTIYLNANRFTGGKETGQSSTKEGNGDWSGSAVRRGPGHPPQTFSLVRGTWDTSGPGECFDYRPATPTYSAGWHVTRSTPLGLGGDGTSSGYRIRP
ncbi:MAG: hypothetical protein U9Q76_04495 [candidate division WOR-3 bacterium]|nr:hypothetical protein [candidate division WOR-3 bacterium]